MPKASLVVILLGFALLLGVPAHAQDTNATNETPTDGEEAAGNETATDAGNETTDGGEATDGGATDAPPEPVTIVLTGHGEGGAFFFQLEGESQRNPRLTVQPGQEVTVTLRTVSGAIHNFCTDAAGERQCTPLVSEGDEASITFTAPESGTFEYWCDPHRGSGMRGTLAVGAAGGGGDGGGDAEEFVGETVDLGDLGYADCAGTKIPAASAQQAVGGPTVADYVEKCRAGDAGVQQARPAHPADYIIPASWVLIALGVAGVVWVSRSYRP